MSTQERTDGRETNSLFLAVGLITFAALAALYLAWPLWRAFLPLQIVYSDAWNTYHADDFSLGHSLYPGPDALVSNNYPPLSFYLVSTLSAGTGVDSLLVGRLLSLLGAMATGLAVAFVVRQLGGSKIGALVGALSFVATAARFYAPYVGINDPHLLALAIMVWAQVWFLRRQGKDLAVEPAIILMVIACFYKHTLLAVPAASIGYLALSDRGRALRAALVGIGTGALGLTLCALVYGYAFFQNLLMPREYYSLVHPLLSLGRLQWIAPSLAIFGIWAWHRRQGEAVRFTGLFVFMAFINQYVQLTGVGVQENVHFELIAAAAIGVGLAFSDIAAIPFAQRWGLERARFSIILILVARLLLSSRLSPYLLVVSPDFHNLIRQRVAIETSEIARIAAISGPVACSVMLVCRWAGKQFLFDPFAVGQRAATGNISPSIIDQRVRAIGLRFEAIDPRADLDAILLP